MANVFTEGKDLIAGGKVYHPDEDGYVEIPDDVAKAEGYAVDDDAGGPTFVELKAQCKALGIPVPRNATKDSMVELIAAAKAEGK